MRIAIDARTLQDNKKSLLSISRIIINLLREWVVHRPGHEYILYLENDQLRYNDSLLDRSPVIKKVIGSRKMLRYGLVWENLFLPLALREDKADLLFSPSYTTAVAANIPTYVAVHDISYKVIGHEVSFRQRNLQNFFSYLSCRRSRKIITISNYSKNEIVKYYGIDPSRVEVIYLGIEDFFSPSNGTTVKNITLGTEVIDGAYLLYAGTMFNRRHVKELAMAFEKLLKQGTRLSLVLVGSNKTNPLYDLNGEIARINAAYPNGKAHWFEYVTDEELLRLYRNCEIFLYLSTYEGFGFPPLEAMACGKPVITGDKTSLPEIVRDGAVCIDPGNVGIISETINHILTNPDQRNYLIKRGPEIASEFTWAKAALKLMTIFEKTA